MNATIEQWVKAELEGLYGSAVIREMNEIIALYDAYDGKGQAWPKKSDGSYEPAQVITNYVKLLINSESRFMVGRAPEIRIRPLKPSDEAAAQEIDRWLQRLLNHRQWRKRLLHGVRDALIGKRVALKLTAAPGEPPSMRFAPSLEFVFEADEDDPEQVKKCVFFYEATPGTVTDRTKQRIWRQRYELRDGRCYLDEGLYDGYGREIERRYRDTDTGLDFVPVYIIINGGLSGDLSGESDVKELLSSQEAYNRAKSDDIDALRYNMFPQKVFTDASQESMEKVQIAPNAVIDLQSEQALGSGARATATVLESTFNYDSRLQHSLEGLRADMHALMSVPEVSAEVLQGIGISGKAMRALYWNLICRCEEKWADGWEDAIRWMVERLIELARLNGEKLPEIAYDIHIEHLYPLIDDEEEERERDMAEVSRQARSRKSYIEKWHGEGSAEEELEQIKREQTLLEEVWPGE